jgi:hypothetical protein
MQAISNVSVLWGRLAVLLQHPTQDAVLLQHPKQGAAAL